MNIESAQVKNANAEINSMRFSVEEFVVKVNSGHLDRVLSDMVKIIFDKECVSQLMGDYQENSDGMFHSYSTEEVNAEGTNKVNLYIEAEYSAGNISGYIIRYTEYDTEGNILGSSVSKLDSAGTTIENDSAESGMQSDIDTEAYAGKDFLLAESINSFSLNGVDIANTFPASHIMFVPPLVGVIIGVS